jgi:L-iditol 2-dehydrogenase
MGHEYSGTVAEVGADVDGFEVGQQVVKEPIHSCD